MTFKVVSSLNIYKPSLFSGGFVFVLGYFKILAVFGKMCIFAAEIEFQ